MSNSNRALRHHIRNCMAAYATYHQDNDLALKAMALTILTLNGQPGLSQQERSERVSKAHDIIAELFSSDEYNQLLIEAHLAVHALMEMTKVEIPASAEVTASEPDPEVDSILAKYEEEFANPTKE